MSWVIGGVIGEGKVGGKELNVRNNDGRMLLMYKVKDAPLTQRGHTLQVGGAMCHVYRCYPNHLLILGRRRPIGFFNNEGMGGDKVSTLG